MKSDLILWKIGDLVSENCTNLSLSFVVLAISIRSLSLKAGILHLQTDAIKKMLRYIYILFFLLSFLQLSLLSEIDSMEASLINIIINQLLD